MLAAARDRSNAPPPGPAPDRQQSGIEDYIPTAIARPHGPSASTPASGTLKLPPPSWGSNLVLDLKSYLITKSKKDNYSDSPILYHRIESTVSLGDTSHWFVRVLPRSVASSDCNEPFRCRSTTRVPLQHFSPKTEPQRFTRSLFKHTSLAFCPAGP